MPRLTLKFGVVEMQTMVKKYQQRFRKVRDEMDSWAVLQSPGPAPTAAGEEHRMTLRTGPLSKPGSWSSTDHHQIPELCSTSPASLSTHSPAPAASPSSRSSLS
ncbi:hypothetical protein FF1_000286 [Malus domestica]